MLTITLLVFASLPAWLLVRRAMRRRAEAHRWRVVTRTIEDGTRQVVLTGPGNERLMKELPASLDGLQLEMELLDARSKAFAEALRLNRPPAPRAHA